MIDSPGPELGILIACGSCLIPLAVYFLLWKGIQAIFTSKPTRRSENSPDYSGYAPEIKAMYDEIDRRNSRGND